MHAGMAASRQMILPGGVVMWVVDGDGRDLNGFDATTPKSRSTTQRVTGTQLPSLQRHPYIFACFACWDDFRFNPGLVLAPSQAKKRLMCSYHRIGSYRYKCPSCALRGLLAWLCTSRVR